MAQLDQLINAMFQHNGEALVLEPDQKPSLMAGGQPRPIVKSALSAAHVSKLTSEIAPAEQRAAIAGGGTGSFSYEVGGKSVAVEIAAGPKATIGLDPGLRTGVKVAVVDATGRDVEARLGVVHAGRTEGEPGGLGGKVLCLDHDVVGT